MTKTTGRRPMTEGVAFLIESDLERAELVLSAKSITDSLQKMAEQLARVEANDLMPILDPMRTAFGAPAADSFNKVVTEKARGLIEAIKAAKEAIGIEISRLEGTMNGKTPNDMAVEPTPDDKPSPADGDMGDVMDGLDDLDGDDLGTTDDADKQGMSDEKKGGDPFAALFKDDEKQQMGNAAGRAKKESRSRVVGNPLIESVDPDAVVLRRFRHLLGEGLSAAVAAQRTADGFAIEVSDVVEIVKEAKSRKSDPCWKGYKQVGVKKKGKKEVPNCVPEAFSVPMKTSLVTVCHRIEAEDMVRDLTGQGKDAFIGDAKHDNAEYARVLKDHGLVGVYVREPRILEGKEKKIAETITDQRKAELQQMGYAINTTGQGVQWVRPNPGQRTNAEQAQTSFRDENAAWADLDNHVKKTATSAVNTPNTSATTSSTGTTGSKPPMGSAPKPMAEDVEDETEFVYKRKAKDGTTHGIQKWSNGYHVFRMNRGNVFKRSGPHKDLDAAKQSIEESFRKRSA